MHRSIGHIEMNANTFSSWFWGWLLEHSWLQIGQMRVQLVQGWPLRWVLAEVGPGMMLASEVGPGMMLDSEVGPGMMLEEVIFQTSYTMLLMCLVLAVGSGGQ